MYYLVRARTAITLLLLALPVLACDSSTAPDPPFDPRVMSSALQSLIEPMRPAEAGHVLLDDALEGLAEKGLVISDPTDAPPLAAERTYQVDSWAGSVVIPDSLLGRTFVYIGDIRQWVSDGTQTGAPADGFRVVWYALDSQGLVLLPVDSIGYIDLRDRDTGDTTAVDLNLVATPTNGTPLSVARFGQRFYTTGTTNFTEAFEATGLYTESNESAVGFDATLDYDGVLDTGDGNFDITLSLQGAGTQYIVATSGVEEAGATVEQEFEASVVQGALDVALQLSLSGSGPSQTGTGTLSSAGEVIADITVSGNSLSFRSPDGDRFSDRTSFDLNDLASRMFLYSYQTFAILPFILL